MSGEDRHCPGEEIVKRRSRVPVILVGASLQAWGKRGGGQIGISGDYTSKVGLWGMAAMLLRTLLGEQVGAGRRAADSGQSQGMPVGGLDIQRRVGKMGAAQSALPRLEAPGALLMASLAGGSLAAPLPEVVPAATHGASRAVLSLLFACPLACAAAPLSPH